MLHGVQFSPAKTLVFLLDHPVSVSGGSPTFVRWNILLLAPGILGRETGFTSVFGFTVNVW